jgi:uncharacterized membrane protein
VFAVTLVVGLVVVAAVALAPLYVERCRLPRGSRALGAVLVGAALTLAVPAALWQVTLLPSRNDVFLVAFVLLLLGALLIIAAGGGDDEPGGNGEEPPWWPTFETDFWGYARRQRRVASTATRR